MILTLLPALAAVVGVDHNPVGVFERLVRDRPQDAVPALHVVATLRPVDPLEYPIIVMQCITAGKRFRLPNVVTHYGPSARFGAGTEYGVNGWNANEKDRRLYAAGSEGGADEQRD
jgi:hypothetical protein